MENQEEANSSTQEETTEEAVATEQEGESTTSETPTESGEVEAEAKAEGEETQDDLEIVEQDGKQLIPKARFDQINERMKKAEEAAAFVETLRNDPEARKQFFGEQKSEATPPAQTSKAPTVSPVAKFIAESVPEESRQHYQGLVGAIREEIKAEYKAELEQASAPIMKFIGNMILKEARATKPNFQKYEPTILQLMAANPNLDIDAAYKQASYDDLVKSQQKSKQVQQHNKKLTKAPLNKNPGSSVQPNPKKAATMDEALERAWNKQGQ